MSEQKRPLKYTIDREAKTITWELGWPDGVDGVPWGPDTQVYLDAEELDALTEPYPDFFEWDPPFGSQGFDIQDIANLYHELFPNRNYFVDFNYPEDYGGDLMIRLS